MNILNNFLFCFKLSCNNLFVHCWCFLLGSRHQLCIINDKFLFVFFLVSYVNAMCVYINLGSIDLIYLYFIIIAVINPEIWWAKLVAEKRSVLYVLLRWKILASGIEKLVAYLLYTCGLKLCEPLFQTWKCLDFVYQWSISIQKCVLNADAELRVLEVHSDRMTLYTYIRNGIFCLLKLLHNCCFTPWIKAAGLPVMSWLLYHKVILIYIFCIFQGNTGCS